MEKIDNLNNYVKLSVQRALLGNVTTNMRAIAVELNEFDISLLFYYDGKIKENDEETASEIETEVMADFYDYYNIDVNLIRLDYPKPIKNSSGFYIYLREES